MLLEPPDFQLHQIYRALGFWHRNPTLYRPSYIGLARRLGNHNNRILYYDCTNFFFEIEQEDGFRQYGPSKEHRPNPIVEMGLFLDGMGFHWRSVSIAGIPMNRLHCNRWKKKSCVIFLSPSSLFVPTVDCRLYLTVSSTRKVEGRS